MTAVLQSDAPPIHWEAEGAKFAPVALAIAKRNLAGIRRAPSVFISSLLFPIMSIITLAGAYSGVATAPGFPAKSMAGWMLGFTAIQASAMVGMTSGLGLIRDMETRFYDRLLLAPINRGSLIGGLYMAVAVRVLVPFTITLVLAVVTGAVFTAAVVPSILCLLFAAQGAAMLGAGYGIGMGLRLKTFAAAPIMFMTVFALMFMSPVQVPLSFISGWLHKVATINPVTRITSMARAGLTSGITSAEVFQGIAVIVPGTILLAWFAVRGMKKLDK